MRSGEKSTEVNKLSSLFVELDYSFLKEPITMNILLNTTINPPVNLCIKSRKVLTDDLRVDEIYHILVGKSKTYDWLHEFLRIMNELDFGNYFDYNQKNTNSLKYKLKLILILQNLISYNLLKSDFDKTKIILEYIIQEKNYSQIQELISKEPIYLNYGLTLLNELTEIFRYLISSYITNEKFRNIIFKELYTMFQNFINLHLLWKDFMLKKEFDNELFNVFFNFRTKRLNTSLMFLCDAVFLLEGNLNEEYIEGILSFAHYCEIKSTIWRDFVKNVGDSDVNSFEIFKSISKLYYFYLDKNSENIDEKFLNFKNEELNNLKINFSKILKDEKHKNFIKNIDSLIEKYYKGHLQKPKL